MRRVPERGLRRADPRAGFTLVEALAALAVTALLVAVVVPYAGRLAARWAIGQDAMLDADAWMQASARLGDDLLQALPLGIGPDAEMAAAFRAGEDTIQLVRPALARPDTLEIVAYAIRPAGAGSSLVRFSRPFDAATFGLGAPRGDPVTLLQGAFRLRFVAIASDGTRSRGWTPGPLLPAAVELSVGANGRGATPSAPILLPIAARSPAVLSDAGGARQDGAGR